MKLTVQVVIEADDDTPAVVRNVFQLERPPLGPDTLGLGLAEAKDLVAGVQATMVDEQVNAAWPPRWPARSAEAHGGTRAPTRS